MLVKEDESEHVMARVRNESRRGKRVRRLLEVARHSNLFVMMAPIIARATWKMSSSAEVEHDRALRTCVAATASAVAVVEEDSDGSLLPAVAEATIDALSELLYEETRQNRSLASEEWKAHSAVESKVLAHVPPSVERKRRKRKVQRRRPAWH
jgi:hypothetical protein